MNCLNKMKKNSVTYEDIMWMLETIENQAEIISKQNKHIINLHQVLAMHNIEIIKEEKEDD